MDFKIEKNVPVPAKGIWQFYAKKMLIGDSVLVLKINHKAALYNALRKEGFKALTRTEAKGIRVWKSGPLK